MKKVIFKELPKDKAVMQYREFLKTTGKKFAKPVNDELNYGYGEFDGKYIVYFENNGYDGECECSSTIKNPQTIYNRPQKSRLKSAESPNVRHLHVVCPFLRFFDVPVDGVSTSL